MILPEMKTTTSTNKKQVRFSDRTTVIAVRRLSLTKELAHKLWYSREETDLFYEWKSHRVQVVRSQLKSLNTVHNEEGVIINAAAILGLEKYLSPELRAEYKDRRYALERAVLVEHRLHRAMHIPHDISRLAEVSATHSQWAREQAREVALFLEQDVMEDLKEMNLLQVTAQDVHHS